MPSTVSYTAGSEPATLEWVVNHESKARSQTGHMPKKTNMHTNGTRMAMAVSTCQTTEPAVAIKPRRTMRWGHQHERQAFRHCIMGEGPLPLAPIVHQRAPRPQQHLPT